MTVAQSGSSQDRAGAAGTGRRKGRMEKIIEATASGLGNSVVWMVEHWVLFGVFAVIWLAFAAGLVWSQGSLDQTWQTVRSWPILVQLVAWLLFLPVMLGLWVWETTWPFIVRLVLVVGIAGWNLLVFLPRAAQTGPGAG
jgi:ABC-type amino acid transport system permease subunit